MKCYHPQKRTVITGGHKLELVHRCGQCISCRVTISQEWVLRLLLENIYNPVGAIFVTLTLAPEHQHYTPEGDTTLEPEELKNFMKRLRFNTGLTLRYYNIGEYSDDTGHAHYHCIIFGMSYSDYCPKKFLSLSPKQKEILRSRNAPITDLPQIDLEIQRAWQHKGFITVDDFTTGRAQYVMNYVLKKTLSEKQYEEGQYPEFARMSRKPGIGLQAAPNLAAKLISMKLYPSDHLYLKQSEDWKPTKFKQLEYRTGHSQAAPDPSTAQGMYAAGGTQQSTPDGKKYLPISKKLRDDVISEMQRLLSVDDDRSDITSAILNDMQSRTERVRKGVFFNLYKLAYGETEGTELAIEFFDNEDKTAEHKTAKIIRKYDRNKKRSNI